MGRYLEVQATLRTHPRSWLVTGAAGFIGSNLVEHLLRLGQRVVALDNFSTGHARNLDEVRDAVGDRADNLEFIRGDITDPHTCRAACRGVDLVLHQAALGSVPRSIEDPVATNGANISGFLNMLVAARDAGVERFVYAASSSTYGDDPGLPKVESRTGRPLSPYAVTKYVNELYADVFHRTYGIACVGLRYFNVFGPRQDPQGAYAAVIPRWVAALVEGRRCVIFGDGTTSRDFTYVENVVQANLLAATTALPSHEVFNVACGERTSLNDLFGVIRDALSGLAPESRNATPEYRPFRTGDIRHSCAEIAKIREHLGFEATHRLRAGLRETLPWYLAHATEASGSVAIT